MAYFEIESAAGEMRKTGRAKWRPVLGERFQVAIGPFIEVEHMQDALVPFLRMNRADNGWNARANKGKKDGTSHRAAEFPERIRIVLRGGDGHGGWHGCEDYSQGPT